MSKIIVQNIESPSTNTDLTLDPHGTGDVVIASGNLGINNTSPGNKLHVHGAAEFNSHNDTGGSGGYNANGLLIGNASDAGKSSLVSDDRNAVIWNERGLDIDFGTNNAYRMKLSYAGEVLIGLSSGGSSNRLHVKGAATTSIFENESATSSTLQTTILFRNGSSGNVGAIQNNSTSTSYATTSDYRVKENVVDMTGAITRVKSLQPKRFNFIADANDTTVDGFLAHEAQQVVPESVTGTHDEVDADGNAVLQGIDQSKLVPLLVGALQEAITKIETLETQRADLETRVAALEAV